MEIKIPDSRRRKALFVIDVQPATLVEQSRALIPLMVGMIEQTRYDAYIDANYFADEPSMFHKQNGFMVGREQGGGTAHEIKTAIASKNAPWMFVIKNTRSCFKAPNGRELIDFLRLHEIEEAHFIGYDINDCVLGSAFESIDLGYFTYVIEELCHHWEASRTLKEAAIAVFRRQNMSNNDGNIQTRVVRI